MPISEDVSLIARSLGLASALTASMRDSKSGGYPSMRLRKPSENLDVMVLPSTLESLTASTESGSQRRPPERISMPSRVTDALLSRTGSASEDPALVGRANQSGGGGSEHDASAVVLQERSRFQLVQRYRARQSPGVRARKVRAVPRRRPAGALFASVLERLGLGLIAPPPAPCTIDEAIDRITGTDHRPIPPLHSPYYREHGRVLVDAQFERALDRQASGELSPFSSD